ncbi:MAG: hypothetical protein ACI308_00475 [Muribaculaceae bacterium]
MLRKNNNKHSIIFGLNLAQIIDIANQYEKDGNLAQSLWSDVKCREARLIAPMLMPEEQMSLEDSIKWCQQIIDTEEADVLCHKLLRKLSFATDIVAQFAHSHEPLLQYLSFRLLLNLLATGKYASKQEAVALAKEAKEDATPALNLVLDAILEFEA